MKHLPRDWFPTMIFPGSARFLLIALFATAAPGMPENAVPVRSITGISVSAEGATFAFEWLGDLWTASTGGGEIRRVTDDSIQRSAPRFTPAGDRLVHTAQAGGSPQIFSIPVEGGEPVQHTFHSEGSLLETLSPDGGTALVRGLRSRSGYRPTRLMRVDLTRESRELLLFDATAHSASWSPDGGKIAFCRGGEQIYRKGYRGSRASRIWIYDISSSSFRLLVSEETDARSPLWHPDGKGVFYLSAKSGTFNLWSLRDEAPGAVQLTFFEGDGIVFPDVSADGSTFVFRQGFDVHRFRPGLDEQPVPFQLWTRASIPDASVKNEKITGTNSADFDPSLQRVVFSSGGDLWTLTGDGAPPRRLTSTAAHEADVSFSPDGKRLYFQRDDGLQSNYHRASLEDGELRDEQPVTTGSVSKSRFQPSPDGSRIAWIEGTGHLYSANADGSDPRLLFECWDKPTFHWSPCGRWIAFAAKDRHANRDIWLASADASRPPVNLTRHPAFEGSPRWSPDGRRLSFTARRNPSRKAELWHIDFGRNGLDPGLPDDAIQKLADRAKTVPTRGIEPVRVIWAADSRSLLFQSSNAANPRLYSVPVTGKGSMQTLANQRGIPIRVAADGTLLWRVDRTPALLRDGELTRFPISMSLRRDRADILRIGFRRVWRTLGERFYDPSMNRTDWPAIREKYEEAAVSARDSRQFDRIISMLLGELNASHLTFVSRVWPPQRSSGKATPRTAHPGLRFLDRPGEGPLVIAGVLPGSPVSLQQDAPRPGETLVKIAGQAVDNLTPLHHHFNGAGNTSLPVTVRAEDGSLRTLELRCISYSRARLLDAAARNEHRRQEVSAASGPSLTYLPFPRMKRDDLLDLEKQIYRASLESEGLILDLRDNSGGRVADHLLAIFSQPVHSFTAARGGPEGYPHDRRTIAAWNKPLVVLCNENTFSNSEIFCHAMKQSGRAPLVGAATSGGVISAIKQSIPDVGTLQVPFRGWFHADTGLDLEMNGAVPDHPVPLTPEDEVLSRDPQLSRAIEVLREQIAALPEPPAPRLRSSGP